MSLANPSNANEWLSLDATNVGAMGTGAYTVGVLCRRLGPFSYNSRVWTGYQADYYEHRALTIDTNDLYTDGGGTADTNLLYDGTTWYWLVATKPSAVSPGRLHWATYASSGTLTWTHVDATGGSPQPNVAPIAYLQLGDQYAAGFKGDFAAMAAFTTELSDAAIEAAFTQTAQAMYDATPGLLVLAPQATAGTALTDLMGGSGELSRTSGWVASADPSGFDYAIAPDAETTTGSPVYLNGRWNGTSLSPATFDGAVSGSGPAETGTADFGGSGLLTASGVPSFAATVALAGSGSTAGQAAPTLAAAPSATGSGALGVTAIASLADDVDLAGAGSLAGAANLVGHTGTARFTGGGTLSAVAIHMSLATTAHFAAGGVLVARMPGISDRDIAVKATTRTAWSAVPTSAWRAEAPARPWTARSRA